MHDGKHTDTLLRQGVAINWGKIRVKFAAPYLWGKQSKVVSPSLACTKRDALICPTI